MRSVNELIAERIRPLSATTAAIGVSALIAIAIITDSDTHMSRCAIAAAIGGYGIGLFHGVQGEISRRTLMRSNKRQDALN